MPSPSQALRYLREYGLGRALRKLVRTYFFARERMYVVYVNWMEDAKSPLTLDGCEVRPARPDDPLAEAFPHLTSSTITAWLRPDHFFYVLLRGGTLAGYRCVSTTATPSVGGFFRLRRHQLFVVDHFIRPELRRLGLARITKFAVAREVVARGFSEALALEAPTNYDEIISGPRRGVRRIGTLIRTCLLGRVRFALTPMMTLSPELVHRQLALLKQVAPHVSHAGVLFNPTVVTTTAETEQAATASVAQLEAKVTFLPVRDAGDQAGAFEAAFSKGRDAGIQGLLVVSDPMMKEYCRVIVRLVERLGIPAVYDGREFVAAGGLMSYGSPPPCFADIESAMAYRDTRKTGEHRPPGEGTPRFVANRKAAAKLGLAVPPDLVAASVRQPEGSGAEGSGAA